MAIDFSQLWKFDLCRGASKTPPAGACVMDAVSWLEYGNLGDHPPCVCRFLANYARIMNDMLPDAARQGLKKYIPHFVGTVDLQSLELRDTLLWQISIEKVLPMFLNTCGFRDEAIYVLQNKHAFGNIGHVTAFLTSVLVEHGVARVDPIRLCVPGDGISAPDLTIIVRQRAPTAWLGKIEGLIARLQSGWSLSESTALFFTCIDQLISRGYFPSALPDASTVILFETLDALLAIGKQGGDMDEMKAIKGAKQFAIARGELIES